MHDPAELHRWVFNYNMDDGHAPLWSIIDSHRTEFATALLIYWLCNGPWMEMDPAKYDHEVHKEAVSLVRCVRERLLGGNYAKGTVRFDPRKNIDITQTMIDKFTKAGIPKELLEPTYGGFPPSSADREQAG